MVTGVGRIVGPAAAGGAPRAAAGGTGFSVASGVQAAAAPAAAAAVDGLLLLQEVEDGPTRDRHARRHGRAMLDALAALQRALLGEGDDPDVLHRLAALVAHCPSAADPALRATLSAVALRAQVELARRGA